MIKNVQVMTCDVCGKEVSDSGEIMFGGSVHSGWFHVEMISGSTQLEVLMAKKSWDVCGWKCLENMKKGLEKRKKESDKRCLTNFNKVFGNLKGEIKDDKAQ